MNIMQNKPLLIGGGVALIGLVFLLSRSGSAESVQYMTVPNGQSDAQLAAARDIQVATIQANTQAASYNAQLAAQTQAAQSDLAKTQIQAELAKYTLDTDRALQTAQLAANSEISKLQLQGQLESQTYLADMQANISRYTLDQALATTRANNEFQLDYATIASSTSIANQQIQANIANSGIQAQRDITLGLLTSQNNLDMAKLSAARDVQLADIQASADIASMTYQSQANLNALVAGNLGSLKKKNRDDVLQALITGQPYYPGPAGPSRTAQVIGSIGSAAGSILGAIF